MSTSIELIKTTSLIRKILAKNKVDLDPFTLMEYISILKPIMCIPIESIMQSSEQSYQLQAAKMVMASVFNRVKIPDANKLALKITLEVLDEINNKLCHQ